MKCRPDPVRQRRRRRLQGLSGSDRRDCLGRRDASSRPAADSALQSVDVVGLVISEGRGVNPASLLSVFRRSFFLIRSEGLLQDMTMYKTLQRSVRPRPNTLVLDEQNLTTNRQNIYNVGKGQQTSL